MSDSSASSGEVRYWVIVPAAGSGKRVGGDLPKQYLPLAGRSVIEHTLYRLSLQSRIVEIIVVLSKDDSSWRKLHLNWISTPLRTVIGGDERCHSVLNGLKSISARAADNDWVLVHDAARPCLRPDDIESLISECQDEAGGLLGVPVKDTMKQLDETHRITSSLQRDHIWHALTPQMFRYKNLLLALSNVLDKNALVTDEAMAMELAGHRPKMICGHADNIKITYPEDLVLAEFYLEQQTRQGIAVFDPGVDDGG